MVDTDSLKEGDNVEVTQVIKGKFNFAGAQGVRTLDKAKLTLLYRAPESPSEETGQTLRGNLYQT